MGEWIISVAGIAVITVLCDVILPDGQTRKYVKTVLGIVVTFVIVLPVLGLFTKAVDKAFDEQDDVKYSVQQEYLNNAEERRNNTRIQQFKQTLTSNGYAVEKIEASVSDKRLQITFAEKRTVEKELYVQNAAGKTFPSYDVIIIWK